jgi:Cys-rich protein (TIGR01571 family)
MGEIISAARKARLLFCLLGCAGFSCVYSYGFRSGLRTLFNLPEEPCNDFCVHYCCTICAICQEYRELKNRGLDPSKGKYNQGLNMFLIL